MRLSFILYIIVPLGADMQRALSIQEIQGREAPREGRKFCQQERASAPLWNLEDETSTGRKCPILPIN